MRPIAALAIVASLFVALYSLPVKAEECNTPDQDLAVLQTMDGFVSFAQLDKSQVARVEFFAGAAGISDLPKDADYWGAEWVNGQLSIGIFQNGCRIGILNGLPAREVIGRKA